MTLFGLENIQDRPDHSSSMPHRVDPYPMSAQHRRDSYDVLHRRPSPPPIATLNHSPSPSLPQDRSAMSTPPARRSPPQLPGALHTPTYYPRDPVMLQQPSHHHPVPPPPPPHYPSRQDSVGHSYGFSTHPSFDHRYEHNDGSNHSSYHNTVGLPSHQSIPPHIPSGSHVREPYGHAHAYPIPGQAPVASIYTDDANTKLSDRVRRRCFNCCTTDTSTWRRSNLSPGKVLCNKCGLFERTHSRPRPEQFPHKRGPLTSNALNNPNSPNASASGGSNGGGPSNTNNGSTNTSRSRTPPTNQLPPISPAYNQYSHPSIAPLNNLPDHHHHHPHHQQHHPQPHPHSRRTDYTTHTLPGLQTWHPHPDSQNPNAAIGPGGPPPHVAPISLPPPTPTNGHHHHHGHHGQHPTPPLQPLHPPQQPIRRDTADSLASPTSTRNSRPSSPPLSIPPPSGSASSSGQASGGPPGSGESNASGNTRPESSEKENRDSPGSA